MGRYKFDKTGFSPVDLKQVQDGFRKGRKISNKYNRSKIPNNATKHLLQNKR